VSDGVSKILLSLLPILTTLLFPAFPNFLPDGPNLNLGVFSTAALDSVRVIKDERINITLFILDSVVNFRIVHTSYCLLPTR